MRGKLLHVLLIVSVFVFGCFIGRYFELGKAEAGLFACSDYYISSGCRNSGQEDRVYIEVSFNTPMTQTKYGISSQNNKKNRTIIFEKEH